jgi:hypothetical protein
MQRRPLLIMDANAYGLLGIWVHDPRTGAPDDVIDERAPDHHFHLGRAKSGCKGAFPAPDARIVTHPGICYFGAPPNDGERNPLFHGERNPFFLRWQPLAHLLVFVPVSRLPRAPEYIKKDRMESLRNQEHRRRSRSGGLGREKSKFL